ncbi:hypothetical protein CF326_g3537 [Tilletia indica]|nr:hypothetical protein CF326_g3537 [Tilletia indica]
MTNNADTRRWVLPPIPGVPHDVNLPCDTLHGAYLNSGRLSEGLARLHGATFLFKQTATRNDVSAKSMVEAVARVLTTMQDEVKQHLLKVQNKFEEEVDDMKNRVEKEMILAHAAMKTRMEEEIRFANAAIGRKLAWTVSSVEGTLTEANVHSNDGLVQAIDVLNTCGTVLQRDINNTENDYMRSLSHLVMGDTWSNLMPEAVRVAHQLQRDNQNLPPQYGSNNEEQGSTSRTMASSDQAARTPPTETAAA